MDTFTHKGKECEVVSWHQTFVIIKLPNSKRTEKVYFEKKRSASRVSINSKTGEGWDRINTEH